MSFPTGSTFRVFPGRLHYESKLRCRKIIKGIAGFYYVDAAESGIYEDAGREAFSERKG